MRRKAILSIFALLGIVAMLVAMAPAGTQASSHREAPFITTSPKVDGTDFYMFRSYETGRSNYVTLIANYQPLQDAYAGPNYFAMDPNALYEIHIDNNGDGREDITFQFRFTNTLANGGSGVTLPIGGKNVAIPLVQAGQVSTVRDGHLNLAEKFSLTVVRGDRRTGTAALATNATGGATEFDKPVDNIGTKSIADYAGYAAKHIYNIRIPGCNMPGRVFVGQRKEGFAVNLGTIFDLVNAPGADPDHVQIVVDVVQVRRNVTGLWPADLIDECAALRSTLLVWAAPLVHAGKFDQAAIDRIKEGSGNKDTPSDVVALVALYRSKWDQIKGICGVTEEQLDRGGHLPRRDLEFGRDLQGDFVQGERPVSRAPGQRESARVCHSVLARPRGPRSRIGRLSQSWPAKTGQLRGSPWAAAR